MPDASINTEQVSSLMGAGRPQRNNGNQTGIESQWEEIRGIDADHYQYCPLLFANNSNPITTGISLYTSELHERGPCRFLTEMDFQS